MESVQREWITYREAEALVGLSRTKLWQLISSGEIGAAKVGKAVRINKASLEVYLERNAYLETK